MQKREWMIDKLDSLRFNGHVHIIKGLKGCGKTTFIKSYIEHLEGLNIPEHKVLYIDCNKFENDEHKFSFLLQNYIKSLDDGLTRKYTLIIDDLASIKTTRDPKFTDGLIKEEHLWTNHIYSYVDLINYFFDELNYDIYILSSEEVVFYKEMNARLNRRIDVIWYTPKSINETDLTALEYIKTGGLTPLESEINRNAFKSVNEYILDRYHTLTKTALLPQFLQFISVNCDKRLSNRQINIYFNKFIDEKISFRNIQNFLSIADYNLIMKRTYMYDINKNTIQPTYFKYYCTNIDFLHMFALGEDIPTESLLRNLIFIRLLESSILSYGGNYVRYGKPDGITVKYRYLYDFIFRYKNTKYAINFGYGEGKEKAYDDLTKLIGFKRIFITMDDIETYTDKNNIMHINLDKFVRG